MNQCNFIGRLTKDLELKYTQSGKSYVRFTLAVQRLGDKDTADFLSCIAWEKTAENMCFYLGKGNKIGLSCSANSSDYEKDGVKIYRTDFIVRYMYMIDYAKNNEARTTDTSFQSLEEVEEENDYPF